MDFEVERCTRRCARLGRDLSEGEKFYSILLRDGVEIRRQDVSEEAWSGPPPEAIAWWKSRMPSRDAKKSRLAPNDVLLSFFRELEHDPQQSDVLYVVALLLLRRRILRQEESESDTSGREMMVLYCSREETTHRVRVVDVSGERTAEIQAQLSELLFARGE